MSRGAFGEAPPQEFWIDVGGTFTDCIARFPDGQLRTHKLLSSGAYRGRIGKGSTASQICDGERRGDPWDFFRGFRFRLTGSTVVDPDEGGGRSHLAEVRESDPQDGTLGFGNPLTKSPTPGSTYELLSDAPAPVVGIHWLSGKPLDESIGEVRVRLGTTRGTNALLERKGAPTAFVTTAGFGDLLLIGDQTRPKLFDLNIRKPAPLSRMTIELDERVDCTGAILSAIDEHDLRTRLEKARSSGIRALAVCLLNSHRNSQHELIVERTAQSLGFEEITVSSRLSPLEGLLARAETTLINAYLGPVMRRYVEELRRWLPRASLLLMTSAGGLAEAESFAAKDGILSGPAGGVVGCAATASDNALPKVIGFDMGGTSTDVSRYDGRFDRRYEMQL